MPRKQQFGIVGLGKIGANLALQALKEGMRVVGYDLKGVPDELREAGIEAADSLEALRDRLNKPRAVFLYIPAGSAWTRC